MTPDGLVIVDKPRDWTSHDVVGKLRRGYGTRTVGHAGTLDPMATGLLPLAFGLATRFAHESLESTKRYEGEITLGEGTDTGDAEGRVTGRAPVPASLPDLDVLAASFTGPREQRPPMYSALKHEGRPLYEYARAGVDVDKPARRIVIERLTLQQLGPATLRFDVLCTKGTYVRVLAEDIARALGTVGYVAALRRESVQPFPAERMVTLESIAARAMTDLPLVSLDEAVAHLALVSLDERTARRLLQGQVVDSTDALRAALGDTVRVHGPGRRFLGLGRVVAPGRVAAKRLVAQQVSEYNPPPSTRP